MNSLDQAMAIPDWIEKKNYYEELFAPFAMALETNNAWLTGDLRVDLYLLFEAYASNIFYNKLIGMDPEEGFRRSAHLMEASLLAQLEGNVSWANSSMDYISTLNNSRQVEELNNDPDAMVQYAEAAGLRTVMAKTLIRLCYSYQNMSGTKENLALQKKLNAMTEKMIGETTIKQKQQLADFRYNRCLFLVKLEDSTNKQAMLAAYDTVLTLLQSCYFDTNPIYQGKIAQIENMRGLMALRLEVENKYEVALGCFRRALVNRSTLLANETNPTKIGEHKFLRANILTGVVDCMVNMPVTEEGIQDLERHKQFLVDYLNECSAAHNVNTYLTSHVAAIAEIDAILASFTSDIVL
jgi:hypothetical protein